MTQNEQIAKIMGWKLIRRKGGAGDIKFLRGLSWNEWVDDTGKFLCFEEKLKFEDTPSGNWLTKKLQARMRQDGWDITISNTDYGFMAEAGRETGNDDYYSSGDEFYSLEPAALHALFCKVFSIR